MSFTSLLEQAEKHIPVVGSLSEKDPLAYQATRGLIDLFNSMQMSLAESYINGLEIPDWLVKSQLDSWISTVYKYFPSLLVSYDWVVKESEQMADNSQNLMAIQYNLPKELFQIMLGNSKIMYPKYSMGLWEKGALHLEEAQIQMLDDLIKKADLQDGDEILDLGCGFGSAANYILSKLPNAKVTGLNLSREHCQYIRKKMEESESYLSSDRFTLYEEDFNKATFPKKFDKIITIGFFEHIGNLTKAFQSMSSYLKEEGKVFIHIIAIRLPHNAYSPFLNKYIFPSMRIWSYEAIPRCNQVLKTQATWFLNGSNYSKTLQTWLKNFDENQEKLKSLNYGISYEKFRRIWRLYLLWCIAYFEACDGQILGNGQYLLTF